jgi:hypothetical protein
MEVMEVDDSWPAAARPKAFTAGTRDQGALFQKSMSAIREGVALLRA